MDPVGTNPFAVLTAAVAPAILTNASSVLCLGTHNRIARVVDRTRVVAREMDSVEAGSAEYQVHAGQLERLQIRAQLLIRALRVLYGALGSFAAATLLSIVGSVLVLYDLHLAFRATAVLALAAGGLAITGLVSGCFLMMRETRLAVQNLAEEAELARRRYSTHQPR